MQNNQQIQANYVAENRANNEENNPFPSPPRNRNVVHASKPYPPGFRFVPRDDELIKEYLKKKIKNLPIPIDEISDVELYEHSPETLAGAYPQLGENEWYFFTPRDRKYPNGSRPKRAADTGYWKATGSDKPISLANKLIGFKKSLVFYNGKPQQGVKTTWIMHEYRVNQAPRSKRHTDDMRLDDWVLCRIYKKAERIRSNNPRGVDHHHAANNSSDQIPLQVKEEDYADQLDPNHGTNDDDAINPNMVVDPTDKIPLQLDNHGKVDAIPDNPVLVDNNGHVDNFEEERYSEQYYHDGLFFDGDFGDSSSLSSLLGDIPLTDSDIHQPSGFGYRFSDEFFIQQQQSLLIPFHQQQLGGPQQQGYFGMQNHGNNYLGSGNYMASLDMQSQRSTFRQVPSSSALSSSSSHVGGVFAGVTTENVRGPPSNGRVKFDVDLVHMTSTRHGHHHPVFVGPSSNMTTTTTTFVDNPSIKAESYNNPYFNQKMPRKRSHCY